MSIYHDDVVGESERQRGQLTSWLAVALTSDFEGRPRTGQVDVAGELPRGLVAPLEQPAWLRGREVGEHQGPRPGFPRRPRRVRGAEVAVRAVIGLAEGRL